MYIQIDVWVRKTLAFVHLSAPMITSLTIVGGGVLPDVGRNDADMWTKSNE